MNELAAILALAEAASRAEKTSLTGVTPTALVMATVVKVEGSAYRRPGARMLITAFGQRSGMISGGCLESDVQERAQQVMASGVPRLVTYDSTSPDDIVFGLGLGCNGIVQVLIEPLDAEDNKGLLAFLSACHAQRAPGGIVTVFHAGKGAKTTDSTKRDTKAIEVAIGSRLLQWPDGRVTFSGEEAGWLDLLTAALSEVSNTTRGTGGCAVVQRVTWEGESLEVLVETITPPISLLIFGAGEDVIPVTMFAKFLGWHVTVIDGRPSYALPERFPAADTVLCLRPENLLACPPAALASEATAIIMTHSYMQDKDLLRALLSQELRYLGILGPRARTERLLEDLAHEGSAFTPERLAQLHGPAGLDIGAETPQEIALSLLAEIQAVLTHHVGGLLSERTTGIHETSEAIC